MAISIKKYIDIVSGVGAGAVVRARELIGRLFTTNALLPTGSFVEFTSADDVGTYFGASSSEYKRAAFYFGWVSKNITKATKISFARWANADTVPQIFGAVATQSVGNWTGVTDGAFIMTLGATTNTMSAMDFSGATTLANVASIIQAAIRTKTGSMWTAATVSYDSVRGSFNFNGGLAGAAAISVSAPLSGTNILVDGKLGWTVNGIFSAGADEETVVDTVTASADASTNFGSFLFMDAITLEQTTDLAVWNDAQNVAYQFLHAVLDADTSTYHTALKNYSGTGLTLLGAAGEYPEMAPMMILAATDYTKTNAVQNYMFQQFALTPSVTTTAKSGTLDDIRINYYGRTQTAGQQIDFYQRGVLMGLATAPVDMNVFANEQWLKDDVASEIMTMLLSNGRISANAVGRSQVLEVIQNSADRALNNGTISVGKILTTNQKLYIASISGSADAWHQVQNIGYWINVVMQSYVTIDSRTEWKAVYTLIYSKDDAIRKVEGTHNLI